MKVAVYTTIFGDYAPLRKVPKQSVQADFFCITDNPKIENPGNWQIVCPGFPRKDLHPRLRAKFFKVFPWQAEEMDVYDVTIYIDGSVQIHSPDFVKYCLDNLKNEILLFRHPERTNIREEAQASMELDKYQHEDIPLQMNTYNDLLGDIEGLYACGIIIRKYSLKILNLMSCWWDDIIKYTYQDQLSFPVVCLMCNVIPDVFPDSQYHNPYFKIQWNAK